jgi:hypothetical protein
MDERHTRVVAGLALLGWAATTVWMGYAYAAADAFTHGRQPACPCPSACPSAWMNRLARKLVVGQGAHSLRAEHAVPPHLSGWWA